MREVVVVKRVVFLAVAVLLVGLAGSAAAAQCGCPPQANAPSCYTGYWAGVDVSFKLVVPVGYFSQCPMPETPLITGWRVEQLDGTIVYQNQFPDVPKGHYLVMTWNQKDSAGHRVAPGFYRLVVQTTTAGEFSNVLKIVARPSIGWGCCCCPQLASCDCCPSFTSPYVQIMQPPKREFSPGTLSISITVPLTGGDCGCGDCCP